jgi:ElaB/YqjD/DUF883 family membrane-anchored ribosome-binding protein
MHSAVMQNKKYIHFANRCTVEVMALGSIERAVSSGHRNARTYEVKDPLSGKTRKEFALFPGLTLEEMQKLNRSKARSYNQSGKIPHTSIVDPFTEEKMAEWTGGISSKTLMEHVKEGIKILRKEHGKPNITRKELFKVRASLKKTLLALGKKNFNTAWSELRGLKKRVRDLPQEVRVEVKPVEEKVMDFAKTKLEMARDLVESNPAKAKMIAGGLASKLAGTALEDMAKEILEEIRSGH